MTWIKKAEEQVKQLGFKSVFGDIQYLFWVVENNFPPPWDEADEVDKKYIREDVEERWRKRREQLQERISYCGVPSIYLNSKGKATKVIADVPLDTMNNFVLIVDGLNFFEKNDGIDSGKTTELCAFIIESVKQGKNAFYMTADDLQSKIEDNEIINEKKPRDWARDVDVLCIDDLGMENQKFKINHVEGVLNQRLDTGKKTVISIACDCEKFLKAYPKIARRLSLFPCISLKNRG